MKRVTRKIRDMDRAVFRAVFRLKWGPLTTVMRWFTVAGAAGFMWGVLAGGAFLLAGMGLVDLAVSWAAVAGSWIFCEAAKRLFDRARPHMRDSEIAPLIKTPGSSSFPSGHSATAAAGAITLSAAYPAFTPLLALAGFLVILSRVYLGVHYPLDVLAGVVIGTLTALALLAVGGILA